jgi:hypothetical protein
MINIADITLLNIMSFLIVIFGISLAIIEILFLKLIYRKSYIIVPSRYDRWIKISHAFVGLYWAIFYFYVFKESILDRFYATSMVLFFVRIGITLTLSIVLANAIFKYRMAKIIQKKE